MLEFGLDLDSQCYVTIFGKLLQRLYTTWPEKEFKREAKNKTYS